MDLRAVPGGPFPVVYADPAWQFETWSDAGKDRAPDQHYETMDIDALMRLPVADIVADDAALFLWVYQPMLREAMDLIGAWGFRLITVAFVWVKIKGPEGQGFLFLDQGAARKGLGYHTRAGTEQVWLATRGKGYERLSKSEPQTVFAAVREHSRKPDEIRTSIERLVGDVPKIELFARTQASGWAAWGNEITKFEAAS
jgi:N6-adenosine-specific RNA methylase IME4